MQNNGVDMKTVNLRTKIEDPLPLHIGPYTRAVL